MVPEQVFAGFFHEERVRGFDGFLVGFQEGGAVGANL